MGGFAPGSPTVRTADHSQLVISGAAAAGKVLTGTGPSAASWQDAGGGGAFGGAALLSPTVMTVNPQGGGTGQQILPGTWTSQPYKNGQPAPAVVDHPAQYTFGFAEAGWYRLVPFVSLGFTAGATPLPDHFEVQFAEYNVITGFAHDVACSQPLGFITMSSRQLYGAQAVLPSYAFYQEADATTGAGGGVQIILYFPGDATPSNGSGGPLTVGTLKVYVERLA